MVSRIASPRLLRQRVRCGGDRVPRVPALLVAAESCHPSRSTARGRRNRRPVERPGMRNVQTVAQGVLRRSTGRVERRGVGGCGRRLPG
jgi:hypothetical protein